MAHMVAWALFCCSSFVCYSNYWKHCVFIYINLTLYCTVRTNGSKWFTHTQILVDCTEARGASSVKCEYTFVSYVSKSSLFLHMYIEYGYSVKRWRSSKFGFMLYDRVKWNAVTHWYTHHTTHITFKLTYTHVLLRI